MDIKSDLTVNSKQLGKFIICKSLCPNLIFVPLFFFNGVSLLALAIAVIGRGIIAGQIERMFTKEAAYLYLLKNEIAKKEEARRNG